MKTASHVLDVLKYIVKNEPVTIEDIEKNINISRRVVYKYLKILEGHNFIYYTKETHKSKRIIYFNSNIYLNHKEV